jgi:hypothetical protein
MLYGMSGDNGTVEVTAEACPAPWNKLMAIRAGYPLH